MTAEHQKLFEYAILAGLLFSGLAICVATWLPRNRSLADFLMIIGGTAAPIGLAGPILINEVPDLYHLYPLENAFLGLMTIGVLVFAMGFILDRIARRRVASFEAHAPPPPGMGPPNSDAPLDRR